MEKQNLFLSRDLTLEELKDSVTSLENFKKYSFCDPDFTWKCAIEEYFEEEIEDKEKFREEHNKPRKERSAWFNEEIENVKKIYFNLIENRKKTPAEEKFDKEGMPAEDRFNPEWHRSCVKSFIEELKRLPGIEESDLVAIYDVSGDRFIYGGSYENIKKRLMDSGIDEKEIKNYIENLNCRVIKYSKTQHGSLCYTPYINGKPFSTIFLSPYRNITDTFQTMWHEITHFMQNEDKRLAEELAYLDEEEGRLKLKFKNKEINEKEYDEEKQRLDLDNKYKKIKLLLETQANLNGSMITLLRNIIYGSNDVELDKVQRGLMLAAGASYEGDYCDFILTRDNLEKLRQDKSFRDLFIKDGNIDYDSLYEYTYNESLKQIDEIISFAEREEVALKELEKREDLQRKEGNPILKLIKVKEEYLQKYPLTEQEEIEKGIYDYRFSKDRSNKTYEYLVEKAEELDRKQQQELSEMLVEAELDLDRGAKRETELAVAV